MPFHQNIAKIITLGKKTPGLFPFIAVGNKEVRDFVVGHAAALGKAARKREKTASPAVRAQSQFARSVQFIPEVYFKVLGAGADLLDLATDAALKGSPIEPLVDIPEDLLQDAFKSLSAIARALRTGEK